MELKIIKDSLTVCKLASTDDIDLNKDFYFIGKTDEEISLVCRTEDTPEHTTEREDRWKGFRIQGVLDFSLIGILVKNQIWCKVSDFPPHAPNFEAVKSRKSYGYFIYGYF